MAHVDDLLLSGDDSARAWFDKVGQELDMAPSSVRTSCGAENASDELRMRPSGFRWWSTIATCEKQNSRPVDDETLKLLSLTLNDASLELFIGSRLWRSFALTFDMAFTMSSLQSAEPTVRTLLRANAAVRVVRQDSNFELTFRPIDYRTAGLMVVTAASLGSVKLNGSCEGTPAGLLLCGL